MEESAFETDCKALIGAFVAADNTSFQAFCSEWMNHKFYFVFHGFSRILDIVEFTDMCLPIAKLLFLRAEHFKERLGAFYLLYTLYFKQPAKEFTKIRMTQSDWHVMKVFYERISQSNDYIQANLIFWKLIQRNAYKYVGNDHEFGLSIYMSKFDGETQNNDVLKKLEAGNTKEEIMNFVNERNGIVSAIQLLEMGYNEMKEGLKDPRNEKLLPQSSCAKDILSGLQQINDIFNPVCISDCALNDSRKKMLKKKAAYKSKNAKERNPKKIRTTMWKKVVKVNNGNLEITAPYRDAKKKYRSFVHKLFNQSDDTVDCDLEAVTDDEHDQEVSETEEVLPDIT
ncbi:snRNA-activating protein complex subunit 1 [Lutzomyia longipalpis]|uniref:snRNA-activating protein complex subunit 1 n=1 Tax=Lutzomyia longipalpis TaxID=7200 RepID=UPI00248358EE|nr:snRNA-activating protein complex subunit 1 [Lutzomyia longipalpis]